MRSAPEAVARTVEATAVSGLDDHHVSIALAVTGNVGDTLNIGIAANVVKTGAERSLG